MTAYYSSDFSIRVSQLFATQKVGGVGMISAPPPHRIWSTPLG